MIKRIASDPKNKVLSLNESGMKTVGPKALEKYIGREAGSIAVYRHLGHGKYGIEIGFLEQGENENEEDFFITDSIFSSDYDQVPRRGKIPLAHGDLIILYNGKKLLEGFFIDESD